MTIERKTIAQDFTMGVTSGGSLGTNTFSIYRRNVSHQVDVPRSYVTSTAYMKTNLAQSAKAVYSYKYPFAYGKAKGSFIPPSFTMDITASLSESTWDGYTDSQKAIYGSRVLEYTVSDMHITMSPTYVLENGFSTSSILPAYRFSYPTMANNPASEFYALEALSKRLKNTAQSFVTIIEAGKTVSLVKDTLQLFNSLVVLVARRDKKSFRAFCKRLGIKGDTRAKRIWKSALTPAQKWMEYRYGWRPLVKDIEDHSLALADLMARNELAFRVSGYGNTFSPIGSSVTDTYAINENALYVSGESAPVTPSVKWRRDKLGVHYDTRFVCIVRPKTGFTDIASSFRLDNITSTIYEASPLSWMLDWFIPFGSQIEMLSNLKSVEYLDICRVTSTHYVNLFTPQDVSVPVIQATGFHIDSISNKAKPYYSCTSQYERKRLTSLPSPSLSIDLVSSHWKRRIGLNQMLDTFALSMLAFDQRKFVKPNKRIRF